MKNANSALLRLISAEFAPDANAVDTVDEVETVLDDRDDGVADLGLGEQGDGPEDNRTEVHQSPEIPLLHIGEGHHHESDDIGRGHKGVEYALLQVDLTAGLEDGEVGYRRGGSQHAQEEQAEKERDVAILNAEREKEVARLNALKAIEDAKRIRAEGEAEAAANRAKVAAGLTPQEKAQMQKDIAIGIAQALAESKGQWTPMIMNTGAEGKNSPATQFGMALEIDMINKIKSITDKLQ